MLGFSSLAETPLSTLPDTEPAVVLKISGYTRNRCGDVDPGATVILFRTADNIPVATTTSDGTGYYEFTNPAGTPFYAASFSADGLRAGVTANNLTPA